MQLAERIHLVGSGAFGFDLTDPWDCHVYLLDGGTELALVDVGAGMGARALADNVRRAGFDPQRVTHVLCTHAHGDHAGGAAAMRPLLPNAIFAASRQAAQWLAAADEAGTSIAAARSAGVYPADYRLEPCSVEQVLADGDRVALGDLEVECVETPGHSSGHVSFLLDHGGIRSFFAGDLVFHGGTILLQSIHDCSLAEHVASLRKVRDLAVDALLPGHFTFSLRNGQRHIERANEILDRLLIPPQVVHAW